MKIFFPLIILSIILSSTVSFDEYPIINKKEFIQVDSLILDRLPQTNYVLSCARLQWKLQKSHFANHYFIIEWGCGSPCQMYAVFNQIDGKFIGSFNTSNGCEYKKDSRLIIINADPHFEMEERYLIIENNKLKDLTK